MQQTRNRQGSVYQRVLFKLSGEMFANDANSPYDKSRLAEIAQDICSVAHAGIQIAVVVGGGNWMRGRAHKQWGISPLTADQIGMMATVMNALCLRDELLSQGQKVEVLSAIAMQGLVRSFERYHAIKMLNKGKILIFAGGTGNPLVTTDTASSLRAIEIQADIILKGTQVDGIYTADPKKDPNAKMLTQVSFEEALKKEYGVMDLSAFTMCRDNNMPIRVFNAQNKGALLRAASGEAEGTLVGGS